MVSRTAIAAALVALLTGGSGCLSLRRDPHEIAVGARMPALSVLDGEGKTLPLSAIALKGRPVLVFYRGHW